MEQASLKAGARRALRKDIAWLHSVSQTQLHVEDNWGPQREGHSGAGFWGTRCHRDGLCWREARAAPVFSAGLPASPGTPPGCLSPWERR